MSQSTQTMIPVLPESAPFSASQRAWLNGFFAGLVSRAPDASAASAAAAPALPTVVAEHETFPWHDASIELPERMKLAEGRPLERVVMAAMAQLDCGSCGYLCQSYAEAIARGEDKDITKCTPGGKATAKKLREIMSGNVVVSPPPKVEVKVNGSPVSVSAAGHYGRSNPFPARLIVNKRLSAPESAKDTRQIAFDLAGSGLTYSAGDSLGVYAENCFDTVVALLQVLGADGTERVGIGQGNSAPLFEALLRHFTITKPSASLVSLLATSATGDEDRAALAALADDDGPGVPDGVEVLDLLQQHPTARPDAEAFAASLSALQPRLYSISSSPRATPDQVHLTVGCVRYTNRHGRACKGVASTFVADRLAPKRTARIFVQPAHGFALPADGDAPVIMVGPGTGIAPFRAFLQERGATRATGCNWLFFGDQRIEHDFLYRDEIEAALVSGLLTRLDLAFSRDQAEKVYVQHRMIERGAELWQWLQDGAHLYVCGDAQRMAKDVDDALKQIVATHGGMTVDAATAYVKDLAKAGRYQRDVY